MSVIKNDNINSIGLPKSRTDRLEDMTNEPKQVAVRIGEYDDVRSTSKSIRASTKERIGIRLKTLSAISHMVYWYVPRAQEIFWSKIVFQSLSRLHTISRGSCS